MTTWPHNNTTLTSTVKDSPTSCGLKMNTKIKKCFFSNFGVQELAFHLYVKYLPLNVCNVIIIDTQIYNAISGILLSKP